MASRSPATYPTALPSLPRHRSSSSRPPDSPDPTTTAMARILSFSAASCDDDDDDDYNNSNDDDRDTRNNNRNSNMVKPKAHDENLLDIALWRDRRRAAVVAHHHDNDDDDHHDHHHSGTHSSSHVPHLSCGDDDDNDDDLLDLDDDMGDHQVDDDLRDDDGRDDDDSAADEPRALAPTAWRFAKPHFQPIALAAGAAAAAAAAAAVAETARPTSRAGQRRPTLSSTAAATSSNAPVAPAAAVIPTASNPIPLTPSHALLLVRPRPVRAAAPGPIDHSPSDWTCSAARTRPFVSTYHPDPPLCPPQTRVPITAPRSIPPRDVVTALPRRPLRHVPPGLAERHCGPTPPTHRPQSVVPSTLVRGGSSSSGGNAAQPDLFVRPPRSMPSADMRTPNTLSVDTIAGPAANVCATSPMRTSPAGPRFCDHSPQSAYPKQPPRYSHLRRMGPATSTAPPMPYRHSPAPPLSPVLSSSPVSSHSRISVGTSVVAAPVPRPQLVSPSVGGKPLESSSSAMRSSAGRKAPSPRLVPGPDRSDLRSMEHARRGDNNLVGSTAAGSTELLSSLSSTLYGEANVGSIVPELKRPPRRPPKIRTVRSQAEAVSTFCGSIEHARGIPKAAVAPREPASKPLERIHENECAAMDNVRRRQPARNGRKFGPVASDSRLASATRPGAKSFLFQNWPAASNKNLESSQSWDSQVDREDSFYVHMQSGTNRRQSIVTMSKRRIRSAMGLFFDRIKSQRNVAKTSTKEAAVH